MKIPTLPRLLALGLALTSTTLIAQDTLKIGAPQPMTGPDAPFGDKFKKAYTMAVEEINAKGGVNGKKIEVIIEDHQAKNPLAATVAEKLITQNQVLVMTGGRASGQAMEIASVAERLKTPYLVDHPSADAITAKGFDWVFRNNPTGSIYPEAFKKFAEGVPGAMPKSAAVIYDNSLFGKTIGNAVINYLKSKNIPIVADEAYAVNTLDFKPIMTKVKATNPDYMLMIAVSPTDAMLMTRHAKEIGDYAARIRRLRRRFRHRGLRQAARAAGGKRLIRRPPGRAIRTTPRRPRSTRPSRRSTAFIRMSTRSRAMPRFTSWPTRSSAPS